MVSAGVPRSTNATISTRSSSPRSASRRLIATRPKRPRVKSEKAMVVIESAERSGARRNESSASRVSSFTALSGLGLVRLVFGAVVDHAAVAHLDRAVGGLAHQVEVVRRHHDDGAAGVDVAEELEHAAGGALVEVAGRLVGHEDRGVVHQRPGDGHPLLLAAGELARIGPALGGEPHLRQHAHDPRGDGVAPRAGDLEREGDVLRRGPVLEQPEVLEHDAEPPPEPRNLVGAKGAHVVARHPHLAARRPLLGEQQLHDGGLAGAGVAGEEDELALADPEGDVLQGQRAVRIGLVDVGEADHGREANTGAQPLPSASSRSAMMSSASSMPQLRRRNPSGMPSAARSSAERPLCEVSRGSRDQASRRRRGSARG